LLQVNISGEATKGGVAPVEVPDVAVKMGELEGICLTGLMTIAPHGGSEEDCRGVFRRLAELAREVDDMEVPGVSMEHLSMGMTDDYPVAVEEGATLIRVGRAILGERQK
ncbi:MAG: alanine racemase, partial [Bacillota bacterium]